MSEKLVPNMERGEMLLSGSRSVCGTAQGRWLQAEVLGTNSRDKTVTMVRVPWKPQHSFKRQ